MTEKESKKTVDTAENKTVDGKAKFEKVTGKKPSQLETAKQEAAEYKDLALRRMAELEKYRKNNQNISKTSAIYGFGSNYPFCLQSTHFPARRE